jgi:hypothetical protein
VVVEEGRMQTQSRRPELLAGLLVLLAALLALGPLQGAGSGSTTSAELVAAPVTPPALSAARLVRHVPTPTPWSPPHLVAWAGAAVLLLLVGVPGTPWSLSRRERQAYLRPFAGRGPPARS